MNFLSRSVFVVLAYLTCCIFAWPTEYKNLGSNYLPYSSFGSDYVDGYNTFNNQWEAATPYYYYDNSEDDWANQPYTPEELNALDTFALYDNPIWGKVIREQPESELEELRSQEKQLEASANRRQQFEDQNRYFYRTDEKRSEPKRATSTATPTVSALETTTATATVSSHNNNKASSKAPIKVPAYIHSGQKEVPLLRPPNKPKPQANQDASVISLTQRSISNKPSAYDTLRKYLSLEDALKKEAEKRRSGAKRIQKRTAVKQGKQIISDLQSLSGQLSNLKKSITK